MKKKAFVLEDLAEALYEKLLDSKWLNASTSKARYEEEIQVAINKALNDINTIKAMGSPFVDTLIEKYVATLSVDEAKAKHDELTEAASKAGLNQNAEAPPVAEPPKPAAPDVKVNPEDGVRVKLYGSQSQLNQAFDFMKAIGIKYEVE